MTKLGRLDLTQLGADSYQNPRVAADFPDSSNNELYLIAGASGKGSEGDNDKASIIASGKLVVPAALWKVILVLPVGSDDVNQINGQTWISAVWPGRRCDAEYK